MSLSEKIWFPYEEEKITEAIFVRDVREAIQELRLRILKDFKLSGFGKFEIMFKEVFGEKLTNG